MAAGLIKTSSPHCRQIMYIISTNVLLPNERLATAGAWRKIFNIFPFPLQLWNAITFRLIRFRFEKPLKISRTFCPTLFRRQSILKSKIHILPLTCSAIYPSGLFWCEFWRSFCLFLNTMEVDGNRLVVLKEQQNLFPKIMTPLLYLPNYTSQRYHRAAS